MPPTATQLLAPLAKGIFSSRRSRRLEIHLDWNVQLQAEGLDHHDIQFGVGI
jgi:hypothetical protein